MEYLEREDIILINRMTIDQHGGNFVLPDNLLNENGLEYVLEAVKGEVFGQEVYPKIYDKAAVYMFTIISNHVFQDGNKRTGLESGLLFMKLNGYQLKENLSKVALENRQIPESGSDIKEILFHFTMEMASGEINLDESRKWFEENIETISKEGRVV
ncbi:MAG: type II toxin-antitoxin system death-on-curing family toxin [bacterium]|nr:type II toxin-antitoxin system death-on-curing family toxin [bacterium]